jgi:hypothetical protein
MIEKDLADESSKRVWILVPLVRTNIIFFFEASIEKEMNCPSGEVDVLEVNNFGGLYRLKIETDLADESSKHHCAVWTVVPQITPTVVFSSGR